MTLSDGRKVKRKLPGMPRRIEPGATEECAAAEPPRDNPAPAHNPYHGIETRPAARTRAG